MRRPFLRATAIGWECGGIWEETRSRWRSFRPCGTKARGPCTPHPPDDTLQQTVSLACQSMAAQQGHGEARKHSDTHGGAASALHLRRALLQLFAAPSSAVQRGAVQCSAAGRLCHMALCVCVCVFTVTVYC